MGCWQPYVNLPRLYGKEQTEIFVSYLGIFTDHGLGRSCLWQVHFLSCLPGSKDAELGPDFWWGTTSHLLSLGPSWGMLCGRVPSSSCLSVVVPRHKDAGIRPTGCSPGSAVYRY